MLGILGAAAEVPSGIQKEGKEALKVCGFAGF